MEMTLEEKEPMNFMGHMIKEKQAVTIGLTAPNTQLPNLELS